MTLVRSLRAGLLMPLLFGALCAACGGDDDEDEARDPAGGERMGPAGCYIIAEMRCDCAIEEAECSEEGVQTWVDMGCATCAM
ncbi:MAG TPA: hypothetical protein VMG12_02865 [Polyangiaceae bacterium]|nr:hypothetical protein [Polyangiaceae bacterium]